MTGRRQHYDMESLHLLGHRVKTVVLISAKKIHMLMKST